MIKDSFYDRLPTIMREINDVTNEISTFYRDVYPFLIEDTITLPSQNEDLVNGKYFMDYLKTLREILHHHKITHRSRVEEIIPT